MAPRSDATTAPSAGRSGPPPISLPLALLAFFMSGIAGILYEVVWVREFGLRFGNTIHSSALVTGVFMSGLGLGAWLGGWLADRRDRGDSRHALRLYVVAEISIALLGLTIALALPHLDGVSAWASAYGANVTGWHELTAASYGLRYAIAVLLLGPITLLMGCSLTFLVRALVRTDTRIAGWRIGLLYGANTAGAASGCLLVDTFWIPTFGVSSTQVTAALMNIVAACVAARAIQRTRDGRAPASAEAPIGDDIPIAPALVLRHTGGIVLAVFLAGFAGMGLEILWFRFLTSAVGQYRSVFSLLLFEILAGIGVGSVAGGWLSRRTARPRALFVAAQIGLAASTLAAFRLFDLAQLQESIRATIARSPGDPGIVAESILHLGAIFRIVGVPSMLMGCTFPLANALAQGDGRLVGRLAGLIYLGNTSGALCGSLATGFLLLPTWGTRGTTLALVFVALLAVLPLIVTVGGRHDFTGLPRWASIGLGGGAILAILACLAWTATPWDYLIAKSFRATALGSMPGQLESQYVVRASEGLMETIVIADLPDRGRTLFTNGHIMSLTGYDAQRYMRALAHVPLLHLDRPETALVICFGVGNTAHAASLHRTLRRIDVVDISKHVLDHASWFEATNGRVLEDPRVSVFVNDGREHLRMQPEDTYDLVTLEPPPLSFAGVGSLYSREFYALVKSRLKPSGFLSQWLPMPQVPVATLESMVRAFVDVFPDAILLNGDKGDFLLIGRKGAPLTISPSDVGRRLGSEGRVAEDLERYGMGTPTEFFGSFAASGAWLARAVRGSRPLSDDLPLMEYGAIYRKRTDLPRGMIQVGGVAAWCPDCFRHGAPVAGLEDLPSYLGYMGRLYARFVSRRSGAGAPGIEAVGLSQPSADDLARVEGKYGYLRHLRTAL